MFIINNKKNDLSICLAETWLVQSLNFKVPHLYILRCDWFGSYGGAALLINNRLSLLPLPLSPFLGGISVVAAIIGCLSVFSIYIAHPR